MSHYDNGFADGKDDMGTHYPKTSQSDFEEYQRGYLDGVLARIKQDAEKFAPTKPFVVRLNQRVIAQTSIRVLVNATSEEDAIQKALVGESATARVSPREYHDTEEILSEVAEIVPEDSLDWEW